MNIDKITRIGILTSGGDCSGMNSALRAIAKKAKSLGITPFLIKDGYKGLVKNEIIDCDFERLDSALHSGGTFIYSARFPEFAEIKYQKIAVANLKERGIQALVVIGGDGSYRGAQALSQHGVKTIALPGTIDNDIASSDYTIGFFTALNHITKDCESINDTAKSHHRVIIIEVMGHGCGDLAIYAAIAVSPIIVSTDENTKSHDEIIAAIQKCYGQKGSSNIVIVSEGIYDLKKLTADITAKTGIVTRATVLGHLQRGGSPIATDRYISTMMGVTAVEKLVSGVTSACIGWLNNKFVSIDIKEALAMKRPIKRIKKMIDDVNKLNELMHK